MAEWKYELHAQEHGVDSKPAPWMAIVRLIEVLDEKGFYYSELKAEIGRLEANGEPVPTAFREALRDMEASDRPLG